MHEFYIFFVFFSVKLTLLPDYYFQTINQVYFHNTKFCSGCIGCIQNVPEKATHKLINKTHDHSGSEGSNGLQVGNGIRLCSVHP